MCEQSALYSVKDSKLEVKNVNKVFLKNCTKTTKMVITLPKLSKDFRSSIPPNPLQLFLLFDLHQGNSAGKNVKM